MGIMRKFGLVGAVAIFTAHMPAQATVYPDLSINGIITGTRYTVVCTSGIPPPGGCNPSSTISLPFDYSFGGQSPDLIQGENYFSLSITARGGVNGIINDSSGILTGRNLYYSMDSGAGCSQVGCFIEMGRADTFFVGGGVPEPSTWAMMLLGFGGIGFAMRRRRVRALQVA